MKLLILITLLEIQLEETDSIISIEIDHDIATVKYYDYLANEMEIQLKEYRKE